MRIKKPSWLQVKKYSNNRKKKRLIRIRTSIIIIAGIYLILWCLYCHFFISSRWDKTESFLDRLGHDKGFATSFSASLAEDLVFFVALGLVVIVLTTRSLKSYSFREKASALINSNEADGNENLEDYVSEFIAQNIAYNKEVESTITVFDYDDEKTAYHLFIDTKHIIGNFCKDKNFVTKRLYNFFVNKADVEVRGETGQVIALDRIDIETRKITSCIQGHENILLNKEFTRPVDLSIPRNQEIEVRLKFKIWSKTGDLSDRSNEALWNYISVDRYTQDMKLSIENKTTKGIDFQMLKARLNSDGTKSLDFIDNGVIFPNSTFGSKIVAQDLRPKEEIRVYFCKQKQEENMNTLALDGSGSGGKV